MDLLEYTLQNNIVIYGGGCGGSKVGIENPQGDKKGSNNKNNDPISENHSLKKTEKEWNQGL